MRIIEEAALKMDKLAPLSDQECKDCKGKRNSEHVVVLMYDYH